MRCDQCEALMINGIFCHETGCPNSRKRYEDGEWRTVYKCRECGWETTDEDEAARCCQSHEWDEE